MTTANLVGAAIIAIAVAICGYLLHGQYTAQLDANWNWVDTLDVDRETRLNRSIFDIAAGQGFIRPMLGKSGELLLASPSCESLLIDAVASEPPSVDGYVVRLDPEQPQQRRALRLLCETRQGGDLLAEILAANASYRTLAVRDNRHQDIACQGGLPDLEATVFVPRGCKPNTWRVARNLGEGQARATWIAGAEPNAGEFAFLIDPLKPTPFFGDWAMVKPELSGATGSAYTFTDTIDIDPRRPLTIEIAGKMRKLRVLGRLKNEASETEIATIETDATLPPSGPSDLGPLRIDILRSCGLGLEIDRNATGQDPSPGIEQAQESGPCAMEPEAREDRAVGYKVAIDVRSPARLARNGKEGPVSLKVEIVAEPATVMPEKLRRAYKNRPTLYLTRHIMAKCDLLSPDRQPQCALDWVRVPGAHRKIDVSFDLALVDTAEQKLLNPETGIITQSAFDLSLAPIVGLGPQEYGSLAYALSRTRTAGKAVPVRLTIDPGLQALVRDEVVKKASSRREATATVVLIDAGARAGEIKAMASSVQTPKNLHIWDLEAIEADGGSKATLPWRLVASGQRPGSTFKPVTALAAIDVATSTRPENAAIPAETKAKLVAFLDGSMDSGGQAGYLPLATCPQGGFQTIRIPGVFPAWCPKNYGGGGYWRPNASCLDMGPKSPQFGLCQALMVSSNLYFGGVNLKLSAFDHKESYDYRVQTVANHLSFGSPRLDKDGAKIVEDGKVRFARTDILRAGGDISASRLMADAVVLDLTDAEVRDESYLTKVVRTGWGDGAGATPLAMATIYASLGRGKTVRPTLTPQARDEDACPLARAPGECEDLLPDWSEGEDMFGLVRAGLHAVVAKAGGTTAQFRRGGGPLLKLDGMPRLFGKTGTGTYQLMKTGRNGKEYLETRFALWFAGWIEGAPGTPIPDRLAFACLVTGGGQGDTGGGQCAPMINDILTAINAGQAAK